MNDALKKIVDATKKISDLPENAQQSVRERIERLRICLGTCGDYLTGYVNADVNLGKTMCVIYLLARDLDTAIEELVGLHSDASSDKGAKLEQWFSP